jgi:uncharacterized membrane protein YgcG
VNTKTLARAAAVGAVTSVTALLLGNTAAVAQEDSFPDYAFGIAAAGALTIDPLPYVASHDGKFVGDQLLGIGDVLGDHEDDIALGVLTAEAKAGQAETSVTELNLLSILRADLVRTWCEDGKGGLEIINGTLLGQPLPDTSVPGTKVDLSPLLTLTLNDQRRNSDGSLTVTGIELSVLPGATNPDEKLSAEEKAALPGLSALLGAPLDLGASTVGDVLDGVNGALGTDIALGSPLQTITVGAANCHEKGDGGDNGDGGNGDNGSDSGSGTDNGGSQSSTLPAAPAPSVVAAALPVTG